MPTFERVPQTYQSDVPRKSSYAGEYYCPCPREEKPSVNDSQGRRPGHPGAPGSPRIHVETVYVELRIVARTMAIKIISVALGLVACMRSLQTSGFMAQCLLFKR